MRGSEAIERDEAKLYKWISYLFEQLLIGYIKANETDGRDDDEEKRDSHSILDISSISGDLSICWNIKFNSQTLSIFLFLHLRNVFPDHIWNENCLPAFCLLRFPLLTNSWWWNKVYSHKSKENVTVSSANKFRSEIFDSRIESFLSAAIAIETSHSFADAPVCTTGDRIVTVGAFRSENLNVVCEVHADPPPRSFRWKFNSSGESYEISKERHYKNGSQNSVLRYTPVMDQDFGTLTCSGQNEVGEQATPCAFQVILAGKKTKEPNSRWKTFLLLLVFLMSNHCLQTFQTLPHKPSMSH